MKSALGVVCLTVIALTAGAAAAETLAPGDVMIKDGHVGASLTGAAGDPEVGAKTFTDRKLGNCLACHTVSKLSKEQFHGNIGPSLDGVADRYSPEQLRAILVNSKKVLGDKTVMPGFYTLEVGVDVDKKFEGKTILSAEDVENVVAFLSTLKQ
jgi:L-cysteine S-thiosulfotransferase